MPRWNPVSMVEKAAVRVRYEAGDPAPLLAAERGINRDTVLRWVREAGGTTRTRAQARHLRDGVAIDRFRAKYAVALNGCWLWIGALNDDGYALFRSPVSGKAHAYSFLTFVGPIPDGYEVDHVCKTRACVNPAHLESVTHQENIRRSVAHNSLKTECIHGHPFDEANTYVYDGKRACKECRRRVAREGQRARRAA